MDKKYCKNCLRYYCTDADQCNIPNFAFKQSGRIENGKLIDTSIFDDYYDKKRKATGENIRDIAIKKYDKEKENFILQRQSYIFLDRKGKNIYGKPSELNINNDCLFYKGLPTCLRWLTGIGRLFCI